MPGLGNSRWSAEPSSKLSGRDAKTPYEAENIAVPSFGFSLPSFTKKSALTARSPIVLSLSESRSVEMKEPAVKVDATSSQDLVKVETATRVSKVNAAIQATRDQMAKIMGRCRQNRPSTADQTVGKGASASYGGYSKREWREVVVA